MSEALFTQIEPTPWPSGHGELVAVLTLAPDVLARRYDLRFEDGSDNLDRFTAAAFRLSSGRVVGLLRHVGSPSPGTELHADSGEDFLDVVREVLECLGLGADDLAWVREEIPLDHLRPAESSAS